MFTKFHRKSDQTALYIIKFFDNLIFHEFFKNVCPLTKEVWPLLNKVLKEFVAIGETQV